MNLMAATCRGSCGLCRLAATCLSRLRRREFLGVDVPSTRALLLPDFRALQEELEAAPDPFFGLMGVELPQVEELLPPPEELEAPPELPLVVTPESITLREPELPRPIPAAPEVRNGRDSGNWERQRELGMGTGRDNGNWEWELRETAGTGNGNWERQRGMGTGNGNWKLGETADTGNGNWE
ncbi:hypothetical protein TURU_124342 [Turdus rufiventris]|nr:hypothetical protein TURU_124342 [Turdus rufiventris]